MLRRTLNLGILAHVDAGKTTLTERLLHAAGVIDELGRVDDGTTQTDTLALEQQRGITIKSAVATFAIDDVTVNLIDTPGHPDFIAEVERVLACSTAPFSSSRRSKGCRHRRRSSGARSTACACRRSSSSTRPTARGADPDRVVAAIAERLTPAASFRMDGDEETLLWALAENDESLLDGADPERLREELAAQTRRALVHPAFFGSALKGEGVEELMAGVAELLPGEAADEEAPLSGTVFKVERGDDGQKIAYVRLFSGTLRARDRLGEEKVTALAGFVGGRAVQRDAVRAGEIAKVWGLRGARIGDALGVVHPSARTQFPPPTLETVVQPALEADKAALHLALTQLAEQDP